MSSIPQTVPRRKAPEALVAIPAPRPRVNNLPPGELYGDWACCGWQFDQERYAIQTRIPKIAQLLKRRSGAVMLADALVGDYMQTWLSPCRSAAKGRKLVDQLRQSALTGSDAQISAQTVQREASFTPQNYSEGENRPEPSQAGRSPEPEWAWIEVRKPEAVGTEFCIAFDRGDGQWVVQINDPRLVPAFSKRARTRLSGYSVGGLGRLRQYTFPCSGRTHARKVVLQALKTLPEYGANKHRLQEAMK
jgi:hypothetical protein